MFDKTLLCNRNEGRLQWSFKVSLLDKDLAFAIYVASRSLVRSYNHALAPFGLTHTQFLVMTVLWKEDAVPINIIGSRLLLDSGTLSPLLKRLEKIGYLSRQRSRNDERTVIVCLTSMGKSLEDDVKRAVDQLTERTAPASDQTLELKQALEDINRQLRSS